MPRISGGQLHGLVEVTDLVAPLLSDLVEPLLTDLVAPLLVEPLSGRNSGGIRGAKRRVRVYLGKDLLTPDKCTTRLRHCLKNTADSGGCSVGHVSGGTYAECTKHCFLLLSLLTVGHFCLLASL